MPVFLLQDMGALVVTLVKACTLTLYVCIYLLGNQCLTVTVGLFESSYGFQTVGFLVINWNLVLSWSDLIKSAS